MSFHALSAISAVSGSPIGIVDDSSTSCAIFRIPNRFRCLSDILAQQIEWSLLTQFLSDFLLCNRFAHCDILSQPRIDVGANTLVSTSWIWSDRYAQIQVAGEWSGLS